MKQIPQKILALITQVKTFGALGEKYEIIAPIRLLNDGDWLMRIKLLDTGELMPYRYSEILCDPLVSKIEITRTSL